MFARKCTHRRTLVQIWQVLPLIALAFLTCTSKPAFADDTKSKTQSLGNEHGAIATAVSPADTGHVLEFNGYDSYVEAPHISFDAFDAFTIEAWVKGWSRRIAYQGKEGDPENSIWLTWGSPGYSIGWESDQGNDYRYKLDSVAGDRWEHIALVYDGKTQFVFVDGKKIHELAAPKPSPMVKERKLLLGMQESSEENELEPGRHHGIGYLAAIRISSKALYTKPFKPPEKLTSDKSTELLFDMSRKDDNTLDDLSSHKRNGNILHATWVKRSEPK